MDTPVRKTYAEFLHAEGDDSRREVPYGDRNPNVFPGRPLKAIGVRFFDRLTVDVEDPKTNKIVRCESERLDLDTGVIFYGGTVLTRWDLKNPEAVKISKDIAESLLRGMELKNWNIIIYFHEHKKAVPFNPSEDQIHEI